MCWIRTFFLLIIFLKFGILYHPRTSLKVLMSLHDRVVLKTEGTLKLKGLIAININP